jgi:tetratricopeptide (TPR) repeat protein
MHAQKLVEKARDAADRKAWDHAIEFYLQALDLDPDHLEAREGIRKAELAKYEAYYPSAGSRFFATVGARLSASIAGISKNHEGRMKALERVLTKDPKDIKSGLAVGEAAAAAGHRNAALAAFRGVLMVDPKNLDAWKGAGRSLCALGEAREALTAFEEAAKIDPRDQEANRMRKNLAAEVSITKTGIDRSGHSREKLRDGEETDRLEQDARMVRTEDEIQAAVARLEGEVEKNPDDPKIIAELANRLSALKDYDRAIAMYEKAYSLQPTNFDLREKAGDLKISRFDRDIRQAREGGNEADAERLAEERLAFVVDEYRARVKDHPTDLVLHFQLGKALYESGDYDGAIAEFQQTNRDPRRKIESLTMLGKCFLNKGMFDLAENQLRKAIEEMPGMSDRSKDILYSLGQLKEKQGKPGDALAEYKKIYEVDISFKDVAERMETLKKEIA